MTEIMVLRVTFSQSIIGRPSKTARRIIMTANVTIDPTSAENSSVQELQADF